MLYLYHKRAHILSICAFVLLAAGNAALIITHGGEVSLTDDLGIILLTLIPLAFYLLTIVFPGATYALFCRIAQLFKRYRNSDLINDEEIKKTFLRSRFIYLGLTDFILFLTLTELISLLF